MQVLARNGGQFRSKSLPEADAFRFAKCLQANARFTGVSVCPAKSAGKSFVTFNSAADETGAKILAAQAEAREERGRMQAEGYVVALDPSGAFYWVCNTESGEVYEVAHQTDCTCADTVYRCRPAGCLCKHHAVVSEHLERGTVTGFPVIPAVNERRERALRDRELWD